MISCRHEASYKDVKADSAENEINIEEFDYMSKPTNQTRFNEISAITTKSGNAGGKDSEQSGSVVDDTEVEEFLRVLLEGANVPLDTRVPLNSRPPWLDLELLNKGREFGMKYQFGLVFSQFLSLAILFSFRGGLQPLIFTGKSGTPYDAFHRYLSTVTRVVSWCESNVFEEGSEAYDNMAAVRGMHASVFKRMNGASSGELKSLVTMEGRETGLWCTYLEELRKDLRVLSTSNCPFAEISSLRQEDNDEKSGGVTYVNQLDLSLTQFGFVGLSILFPKQFGVHGATEVELKGFVHLWRCLGYLLGIKDRYNICSSGDLEETKKRCRAVIEKWTKPGLRDITPEWEHMYRCAVEGVGYYIPSNLFGATVAYLLWILDIPFPNLWSKITWMERIQFYMYRLVLNYIVRIPGILKLSNFFLNRSLKRARNASGDWLRRKKEKVYDYQKVRAPEQIVS